MHWIIILLFVFLCIFIQNMIVLSASLKNNNNIQPKISLKEIDVKTWKTFEIFSDSEHDLDIILDEIQLKNKRLELNCRAPYPIVWIYKGDGVSNLQVTTGVNTIHGILSESREFTSTGTIGFSRNPSEIDTGNYTCHNLQDINTFTSYYIYLTGEKLFTNSKEQTVIYTEGDTILRIPCSVTHPDVKLSLQKITNGVATFPLNESVSYDSKYGFLLYIPEFNDVEGTYLCNAGFDGNNNISEKINVIKHNAILTCTDDSCLTCPTTTQCGKNTSCKVYKGKPKCSCLPGYTGNPNAGCIDLRETDGCSTTCGRNTACTYNSYYKQIRCQCLSGFSGDPFTGCYSYDDDDA